MSLLCFINNSQSPMFLFDFSSKESTPRNAGDFNPEHAEFLNGIIHLPFFKSLYRVCVHAGWLYWWQKLNTFGPSRIRVKIHRNPTRYSYHKVGQLHLQVVSYWQFCNIIWRFAYQHYVYERYRFSTQTVHYSTTKHSNLRSIS